MVQGRQHVKDQQSCKFVSVAYPTIPISKKEHQPRHDTVFHTLPYARFIEIQSNLMRKKLHRINQDSYFPGGRFSNRDNVRSPIQFRRESQPQHLEKSFFLKNRPMAMGSGGTVNLFQRGRGKPTKNSEFQAI